MAQANQENPSMRADHDETESLSGLANHDTPLVRSNPIPTHLPTLTKLEISQQIQAATEPLTKQIELLVSMVNNLRESQSASSSEGSSAGPSNAERIRPNTYSDMVTGARRAQSRQPLNPASYFPNQMSTTFPTARTRNVFLDDNDEDDNRQTQNSQMEQVVDAIHRLPQILHRDAHQQKVLSTQVPNFRGSKDKFNEFEHLLLNHLRPHQNRLTEEAKLQYFQSLLRDESHRILANIAHQLRNNPQRRPTIIQQRIHQGRTSEKCQSISGTKSLMTPPKKTLVTSWRTSRK